MSIACFFGNRVDEAMDGAGDAPASNAGAHAMRAILPGRPRSKRQAISTAHWDGRRLVAYISGNAAIIATGPKHIVQTLYINTEASLNAIAIEESSGQVAACGGKNVYIYRPIGSDEDVLSWTQTHHLELDYGVTSLSWGSPAELIVGGARLVLWNVDGEKKIIWSQDVPSPTALAIFSHDGGLLASCGSHDRIVKIWRRLSYEIDSTRFDVSYLPHPTSVTNLHWRKPWHSEMNLDSLLYTFCADNKIRVWAYADPHSVAMMQMLTEIDIVSTIQPRRLSVGSTTPRRYAFIIDSRDFSNATEKAVSTAAPGMTDHALEHLIEVANRSPELCVVLDGLGHMSVWGLENAGWRNKNSTEVFNVAHVDDVKISILQGLPHMQDYTQFYVFAGQDSSLSLLVHSYDGIISWYETSVTHLLDTAPRKDRVRQIASWAGHRHPINGVVKSDSGDLLCSWTDAEVLVWKLTSIVVGAGNQLFVLDPPTSKLDRSSPSTPAGLDLANSALPVYSPEVLNALLALGDFKSVDRILCSFQEQLKFFTDGDPLSSTLELSFDSFLSASGQDWARSAQANGTNGNLANGHISVQDIAQRLKENIDRHQIPHLSSAAHSLLGHTIDVAVKLEAHRFSLDEHALRYLQALYTYDVETDLPWSAIISASLSNCQEPLLGLVIEFHGGKLTWESARHSGIFLWLSDVEALRLQMENVARAEYTKHEDRNPVDCSLFYLALGKKHVLQLLWRQSIGIKEREITMKLLANNFDEPRWQATALKNAFALLSKRRFEYGAAFFLLAGGLKDAVHTCVSKVKDLQLAVAIARVYDSPSSQAVLVDLIENTVLPAAVDSEQGRWMATWAYQLLKNHEKAVQVLVRPVHRCVGTPLGTFEGIPGSLNWKANDPLLAVLYVHLRDHLVKKNAWRNVVSPGEENDFVLGSARFYSRMGIDMLAVRLTKNWRFVNETVERKALSIQRGSLVDKQDTEITVTVDGRDETVEDQAENEGQKTKKKPPPTQFIEPSADSLLDSFGF
ncbi:hypothetical protein DV737_g3178, partial [Chaetothyriales sp. CBS 132003]